MYKDKHKRKKRSRYTSSLGNHVPADYVRDFNRSFRFECKVIVRESFINGEDPTFPLSGRHTAAAMYW